MARKSKEFCIATEGATTDGRVIERSWLEQMAATYDPKLYGARVNMEHIKGYTPDSPFKRYGDVLSLRTAEGEDGKMRLYAVIDPTDDLVAMTKARQKVYTSMEVNTKFADTGKAYLVGLAVTDDPASLGTEMLTFSATAEANPLAKRKTHPDNLFSEAVEFTLELDEDAASLFDGFSATIKAMVGKFTRTTDTKFTELQDAITAIAESQQVLLEKYQALEAGSAQAEALKAELEQLSADYTALVQKLNLDPVGQRRERTPGGASAITTDC